MTNRAEFHRNRHVGHPVIGRGRDFIIFDYGNSVKTVISAAGVPFHKGSGPYTQADEIDTAWQVDSGSGWDWIYDSADFLAQARNIFNVGDLFQFTDPQTGEYVKFDPQSLNWIDAGTARQFIGGKSAVAAQVNDYMINYPAAWGAGRHFQYEANADRLAKVAKFDSAAVFPAVTLTGNPVWLELEFSIATSSGVDIYLNGQKWLKAQGERVKSADRIEFRDAATGQNVLWRLDYPRAWDSAGNVTICEYECRRQGGPGSLFITIRVPKAWIDGAVFPIYVDPTTIYSDAGGDGELYKFGDATWAGCHDATDSDSVADTAATCVVQSRHKTAAGGTYEISRGAFPFDTSSIPDGDDISAATGNWYCTGTLDQDADGEDDINLVGTSQASGSALVVGDYDSFGTTLFATAIGIGSFTTSAYNTFTLNATGLAAINKTGYTFLGLREGHDFRDSAIATGNTRNYIFVSTANQTGTSQDPYLEITHAAPSATGDLDVTLGAMTLSGAGTVDVVGTLAKTLADMTLSGAGTVDVVGTLDKTLDAMTLNGAGAVDVVGTLDKTLDAMTLSATGIVGSVATGDLDVTLADMTLSGAGTVDVVGTAGITLADATLSSNGTVDVVGTLAKTLDAMTLSGAGTVDVVGTAGITLADATLSASGAVDVVGTLDKTLDAMTLSATGIVGSAPATGDLDVTLADMTLSGAGAVDVDGTLSATLANITITAAGTIEIDGTLSAGLDNMSGAAVGTVEITADLDATLGAMTLSGAGTIPLFGSLVVTLAAMTLSGAGLVGYVAEADPITGGIISGPGQSGSITNSGLTGIVEGPANVGSV